MNPLFPTHPASQPFAPAAAWRRLRWVALAASSVAAPWFLLGCAQTPAVSVAPAAAAASARSAPATSLPIAPVRNVPEVFFGTTVQDPYRDFENAKNPVVAAWMKAHSDHAQNVLQRIPGRAGLRAQLERLDNAASARVAGVVRVPGDVYFYERRNVGEDQFKLVMRQGLTGSERVLFDPQTLKAATGKPHAINYFSPSPDGRLVAVGVSAAGSEEAAMRMLDTRSGQQMGPVIERAQFGAVSWAPDASEVYFHRMQPLNPGMAATDKYQRSSAVVMPPGGSEASIRPVLRAGQDLGIPATEFPIIEVLPDGRVLATAIDGVSPQFTAWHTTLAALRSGQPQWRKLFDGADQIKGMAVLGDQLVALSFKNAPRSQLLSAPLASFSPATAGVLLPQGARVLTGVAAASDGLYIEAREGNVKKLVRMARRAGSGTGGNANNMSSSGTLDAPRDIALPVEGAFSLGSGAARPDQPGVLIDLQGWARARQIYAVAADGRVSNTGLQPAGPFDAPLDVVNTERLVKSHDGAMVPMSIIHKRGVKLDGNNPTLLYGYASYGITEEPFFSIGRLAWMDAGGIFVVANPRGSSVFGQQWHADGKLAKKPNTWLDFIACAESLIQEGWTRPARLGLWGVSAGGILVGRAMTERPELFAAVVPSVGALDLVRMETTPNGVPNIPEFGSRATEPGFRALLAMSTYHQIKDGVRYPAVLLTHGTNDPRVEVWNSTKTAARLMAASTSGKPVLLRLDYESGHGVGSTKSQVLDERADIYAFLLWQMGVAGFQMPR